MAPVSHKSLDPEEQLFGAMPPQQQQAPQPPLTPPPPPRPPPPPPPSLPSPRAVPGEAQLALLWLKKKQILREDLEKDIHMKVDVAGRIVRIGAFL